MKETPIMMQAESVRRLREGQKTQTRRVVVPQPPPGYLEANARGEGQKHHVHWLTCPYGLPGDRLWVKETWGVRTRVGGGPLSQYPGTWLGLAYKADVDSMDDVTVDLTRYVKSDPDTAQHWRDAVRWQKWRSPLHMPKWASRLTLELTAVRMEPLIDISVADAMAEGAPQTFIEKFERDEPGTKVVAPPYAVECYRQLWQSINGKRAAHAWSENPLVWVLTFRVL